MQFGYKYNYKTTKYDIVDGTKNYRSERISITFRHVPNE